MSPKRSREAELNRAYVQSQVIEASLQHLESTLSEIDPNLRRDLSSYAVRFDDYVRRLREAIRLFQARDIFRLQVAEALGVGKDRGRCRHAAQFTRCR